MFCHNKRLPSGALLEAAGASFFRAVANLYALFTMKSPFFHSAMPLYLPKHLILL
jgi:hypothetical protein